MGRGQGLWLWLANRLDKIWLHQAVKFGFTADLTGTGNRPFLIVLGRVGLGSNFSTCSGLGLSLIHI